MKQNKVLFIGLVWPEPTSSAAGIRILQLVQFFVNQGYEVTFSSAAQKTEASFVFADESVEEVPIVLNSSCFNEFLNELNPSIVVFDRFVSEEHFGWRVTQECPDAIQILDTEDLHFLRAAREVSYKKKTEINLFNEITFREIASILRCDLSLLISEVELNLLETTFQIPSLLLFYLPFLEDVSKGSPKNLKSFDERSDFVFIGNYLHEPNWQTLVELKKNIWPRIRKRLPKSKLHIYGAYSSQKVFDFHKESEGFLVHGKAENAENVISNARILLAPIPFGAGQKGKFVDALKVGTPIATTTVGAESMFDRAVPGVVTDDSADFIEQSVDLYQNQIRWGKAQALGIQILNEKFDRHRYEPYLIQKINEIQSSLELFRNQNFIGKILKQNTFNSLKFMSLWIQEKNKSK